MNRTFSAYLFEQFIEASSPALHSGVWVFRELPSSETDVEHNSTRNVLVSHFCVVD
jgi:hypothetical protein